MSSCCPVGNYCAYASDKTVGCCPYGETCNGIIGGGVVQTTWAQTTWVPSTVWTTTAIPTTTVYGGIVVPGVVSTQPWHPGTTTQYVVPQTTVVQTQQSLYSGGGYCSTLYADGAGLPTTRPGTCGTILVMNRGSRVRSRVGWLVFLTIAAQLML